MFKTHGLVALPVVAIALHGPYIQVVTFAIFSKSADLLQMIQQRIGIVVIVMVNISVSQFDKVGIYQTEMFQLRLFKYHTKIASKH